MSERFVCVKKCFFRKRLWVPGEPLQKRPGEKIPPYFKPKGEVKEVKKELAGAEPKTISEVHKETVSIPVSKPGEVPVGPAKEEAGEVPVGPVKEEAVDSALE